MRCRAGALGISATWSLFFFGYFLCKIDSDLDLDLKLMSDQIRKLVGVL